MGFIANVLTILGLNGPKPPGDPLGAAAWKWIRGIAFENGFVPVTSSLPTLSRDPVTGTVTGQLSYTVPAGLPIAYSIGAAPSHGSVVVDSTGAYTYIPAGTPVTDAFTVTASDGLAATSSIVSLPIVATVDLPSSYDIHGLAVSPDGRRLYVTNTADVGNGHGTVLLIDTATKTLTGSIDGGVSPEAVAISPDGSRLYAVNWGQNRSIVSPQVAGAVTVIDTAHQTVSATIPIGPGPGAAALSPDGRRLYVTNTGLTVSVVDTTTNTLSSTIGFAHSPTRVAVSPDGRRLYVTNVWSVPGPVFGGLLGNVIKAELTVVDTATNTVTGTIPIAGAGSLAFSPDGSVVYVAGSQGLSAINTATNKVINTLDIPASTTAMVVSPDGRTVYLAGCANLGAPTGCSGSVLAVSTGTLTLDNIIPVGDPTKNVGPDGLAVSPDGKYVYAATSAYYGLSPEDNWQLVSAISV